MEDRPFTKEKTEALSFIDQIADMFGMGSEIYKDFINTVQEFGTKSIDINELNRRISNLFKEYPELIVAYNEFQEACNKIGIQSNEEVGISGTSLGRGESSTGPTSLIIAPNGLPSTSLLNPTHSQSNHSIHTTASSYSSPRPAVKDTQNYMKEYHTQGGNDNPLSNMSNSYNANPQFGSCLPQVSPSGSHHPPMFEIHEPATSDGLMDVDSSKSTCRIINTRVETLINTRQKQTGHLQLMPICNTVHEPPFNASVPVSPAGQPPSYISRYLSPSKCIDRMHNSIQFSSITDNVSASLLLMHLQDLSSSSVKRPRAVSATPQTISCSESSSNAPIKLIENSAPRSQKSPVKSAQYEQNESSKEASGFKETRVVNGIEQPAESLISNRDSLIYDRQKKSEHEQLKPICNPVHEPPFNPSVPVSPAAQQPSYISRYLSPSKCIDRMQNSIQFSSITDNVSASLLLMHLQDLSGSTVEHPRSVSATPQPVSSSESSSNAPIKLIENSAPHSQTSPMKPAQYEQNEFSNEGAASKETHVSNSTELLAESFNINSDLKSGIVRLETPIKSSKTKARNDKASASKNEIKLSCDNHVRMHLQIPPPTYPIPSPGYQTPAINYLAPPPRYPIFPLVYPAPPRRQPAESTITNNALESSNEGVGTANNSSKTESDNEKTNVSENKIQVSCDYHNMTSPQTSPPGYPTPNQVLMMTSNVNRHLSPHHTMTSRKTLHSHCMPSSPSLPDAGSAVIRDVSTIDVSGVDTPNAPSISPTPTPNNSNLESNQLPFTWNTTPMDTLINTTSPYNPEQFFSNAACLPAFELAFGTNNSSTFASSYFSSRSILQLQGESDSCTNMLHNRGGTAISCIDSCHIQDSFTNSDITSNFGLHQSLPLQTSPAINLQQLTYNSIPHVDNSFESTSYTPLPTKPGGKMESHEKN